MAIGTSLGAYFDSEALMHLNAPFYPDSSGDPSELEPGNSQMKDPNIEMSPDTVYDKKKFAPIETPVSDKIAPDYDYDSWQKANPGVEMAPGQHYPDTYKLPNHMTFSDESIYSNDKSPGGHWGQEDGKDTFTPSEFNLKQHSPEEMQDYFNRVEPDSKLILPHSEIKTNNPMVTFTDKDIDTGINMATALTTAPEKIASAALKYGGKLYEGLNHGFALENILKENPSAGMKDIQDGFTTSKGRFVSREEAYDIADKAKQMGSDMKDVPDESKMLLSEDLNHVQDKMFNLSH